MQLRTRGITYKPKVNCEDLLLNNGESNHLEPAGIGRKMQNGTAPRPKRYVALPGLSKFRIKEEASDLV
jgi:hypothetical protein